VSENEFQEFEATLHALVKRMLAERAEELRAAGLTADVDEVKRAEPPDGYQSYIEATIYRDGEVDDVLFFYVSWQGRVNVSEPGIEQWLTEAIDGLVRQGESSHPST
jgi:hypothetical protein